MTPDINQGAGDMTDTVKTKIVEHLEAEKGGREVQVIDQTLSTAMLAVQGPKAEAVMRNFSGALANLKKNEVGEFMGECFTEYGVSGQDEALLRKGAARERQPAQSPVQPRQAVYSLP